MSILALQMAIADDGTGTSHPNAIFIPLDAIMNFVEQKGSVGWQCWHDAPTLIAHLSGKSADGPITTPSCQIRQQLDQADYQTDGELSITATTYSGAVGQSLVYVAKLVKDTPGVNDDGTPMLDSNKQPILVSRFEKATVVQIG